MTAKPSLRTLVLKHDSDNFKPLLSSVTVFLSPTLDTIYYFLYILIHGAYGVMVAQGLVEPLA